MHNPHLGVSTTVTVDGFDPKSVKKTIPAGAAAYVSSVTVNGVASVTGRCFIDFYDTFKKGGNITFTVTSDVDEVDSCEGQLPDSLSTGGWAAAR